MQPSHQTQKKKKKPFDEIRLVVSWSLTVAAEHKTCHRDRSAYGNFLCCYTQMEVADQTHLTQPQNTYMGPTNPSMDPLMSDVWSSSD